MFFGIIGTILRFCYINSVNVKSKCYAVNDKCTAEAMVTMERSTGRILYSKNKDKILPMASTTKIITAIVAIESGFDLDEKHLIIALLKLDAQTILSCGESEYINVWKIDRKKITMN